MQRILTQLGEDATCTPFGGTAATVRGVFLKPFHSLDGGLIESSEPGFVGLTSDLAGIKHGDPIVRSGITYTVGGIEPDGVSGLTTLRLKL
jgi:hypothetical protein